MNEVHTVAIGNTRTPVGFLLKQGGQPVDLSSLTLKVYGETAAGAAWITETTSNVTAHPTNTFTVDTTTDKLKHNATKANNGDQIVVSTTTTLPSGLSASTRYFVVNKEPNAFQVSLTPDGAAVDITSSGSGTHSYYIVGSGQYDFQSGDVDEAGDFYLWPRAYESSEYDSFPINEDGSGLVVRVVPLGN